jgi:RNA polymerase sigma-70 factor (ECF subfamily)
MTPDPRALPTGDWTSAPERLAVCRTWWDDYGEAVYSYVRFHVSSADEAEDITADTFFKVFQAADRYDPARGEARVWIFRIAQNTLRDFQRRARVRRHVSLGSMHDLAAEAPSPEERLLWEEQVARLLAAMEHLSVADREIVSLRYGSGLDTSAVAEILGTRESVVRTRLWRALGRLRRTLGENEE